MLREHIRAATEALSRANTDDRVRGDLNTAQARDLKQALLHVARRQIGAAAELALSSAGTAGLPGLPAGDRDDTAARAGQLALAAAWNALGELALFRGDGDTGVAAFGKALELSPDDVTANAQLAELLESRHDVAAAKAHAERALRSDPGAFAAGLALARCLMREEKFVAAERAALTATKSSRATADELALAWTLVGEARDRLNNTRDAFKAFMQANQLMRQRHGDLQQRSHPAHPANVRAFTEFVERSSAAAWRPGAALATPAPAFLVGFPRSGTTLIEQALSSHANVVCLGETDHLFHAMSVVLKEGDLLERMSALTPAEIETVRAAYRRIVIADYPEADGRLIVDKHPLHISILPLIHKVFPDAKIIVAGRDPRDVVLSCYQQCFGANVATAQFWDLRRAADYYHAVMTLLTACREKLRLDLHEMAYRDVVVDFEGEMRKLADFLELAFDPAMLRYHETARRRTITSASARQVIRPIYDRSLQRWRRYARELAPVLPALNDWARRLGYEI